MADESDASKSPHWSTPREETPLKWWQTLLLIGCALLVAWANRLGVTWHDVWTWLAFALTAVVSVVGGFLLLQSAYRTAIRLGFTVPLIVITILLSLILLALITR